jgi:hypothetical protein
MPEFTEKDVLKYKAEQEQYEREKARKYKRKYVPNTNQLQWGWYARYRFLEEHARSVVNEKGYDGLQFTDVVVWGRNEKGERFTDFLSTQSCTGCGGQKGVHVGHKDGPRRPDLAVQVEIVRMTKMRQNSDAGMYNVKACDCAQRLVELTQAIFLDPSFPKLLQDTRWSHDRSTSIPTRGINDFNRSMTFERQLKPEQLQTLVEWLAKNQCPGWTGVMASHHPQADGSCDYNFHTTWDSSD